jgi:RimJ/RimL family protein N-acetyltransferase
MVLKENNTLIGGIDVVGYIDGVPVIGYAISRKYWNQGYMTEALKAFCKWLFHNTDQNIIWALPGGIYKEASIKVLKKCNFIRSNREADQDWYELRRR